VAYIPFLFGRYPGSVGIPGIRWLDRRGCRRRMARAMAGRAQLLRRAGRLAEPRYRARLHRCSDLVPDSIAIL